MNALLNVVFDGIWDAMNREQKNGRVSSGGAPRVKAERKVARSAKRKVSKSARKKSRRSLPQADDVAGPGPVDTVALRLDPTAPSELVGDPVIGDLGTRYLPNFCYLGFRQIRNHRLPALIFFSSQGFGVVGAPRLEPGTC